MSDIKFWRYSLPPIDSIEGWGIFLLDSTGMFAAVTDYGNYAFKWTHHGCKDFREFFIDIKHGSDNEYYIKKLFQGQEKEFDGENTIKSIKEHILYYRRDGSYSKEFAREEWDLIKEYEHNFISVIDFTRWHDETKIDEAHEFACYDYPSDIKAFGQKLLPRLADVLREELQKEAA
ncbi:hypothetical protein SAMN05660649_04288 [Desulfotomaculum arcticum]|uniref:Uncharacterized protein n=1 Tax=Desulfotruncus arcticus DSM 17038 TaxID=1121424 RepID=A0A1I2Y7R7_9FIRM|nr:hypothetical protein [Desulfotruncus arcticus]SFH21672.1 hypothetical protein SAMN05660649_04288 [Desulfotomaculum arcticum] [Desulfotruncus arcticus DSM 17038]